MDKGCKGGVIPEGGDSIGLSEFMSSVLDSWNEIVSQESRMPLHMQEHPIARAIRSNVGGLVSSANKSAFVSHNTRVHVLSQVAESTKTQLLSEDNRRMLESHILNLSVNYLSPENRKTLEELWTELRPQIHEILHDKNASLGRKCAMARIAAYLHPSVKNLETYLDLISDILDQGEVFFSSDLRNPEDIVLQEEGGIEYDRFLLFAEFLDQFPSELVDRTHDYFLAISKEKTRWTKETELWFQDNSLRYSSELIEEDEEYDPSLRTMANIQKTSGFVIFMAQDYGDISLLHKLQLLHKKLWLDDELDEEIANSIQAMEEAEVVRNLLPDSCLKWEAEVFQNVKKEKWDVYKRRVFADMLAGGVGKFFSWKHKEEFDFFLLTMLLSGAEDSIGRVFDIGSLEKMASKEFLQYLISFQFLFSKKGVSSHTIEVANLFPNTDLFKIEAIIGWLYSLNSDTVAEAAEILLPGWLATILWEMFPKVMKHCEGLPEEDREGRWQYWRLAGDILVVCDWSPDDIQTLYQTAFEEYGDEQAWKNLVDYLFENEQYGDAFEFCKNLDSTKKDVKDRLFFAATFAEEKKFIAENITPLLASDKIQSPEEAAIIAYQLLTSSSLSDVMRGMEIVFSYNFHSLHPAFEAIVAMANIVAEQYITAALALLPTLSGRTNTQLMPTQVEMLFGLYSARFSSIVLGDIVSANQYWEMLEQIFFHGMKAIESEDFTKARRIMAPICNIVRSLFPENGNRAFECTFETQEEAKVLLCALQEILAIESDTFQEVFSSEPWRHTTIVTSSEDGQSNQIDYTYSTLLIRMGSVFNEFASRWELATDEDSMADRNADSLQRAGLIQFAKNYAETEKIPLILSASKISIHLH